MIEAKKIIRVVTVTGADDSIRPEELVSIAKEYPYVEFGILLSKSQQGGKRFPSQDWLKELYIVWRQEKLNLSSHICGSWVRNLCLGMPDFFEDIGCIHKMFGRIQLNFHAENHRINNEKFTGLVRKYFVSKPIIFPMDGVNEEIFFALDEGLGSQMFPLFDYSGGRGLLPKEWPRQLPNKYTGYSGGLSPDNLQEQLERISMVASGPIWIDGETLVRSEDDKLFDLGKVCRFLEVAKPRVIS